MISEQVVRIHAHGAQVAEAYLGLQVLSATEVFSLNGIILKLGTGVLLLICVCKPAVGAVGRAHHAVGRVGIPEAVLGEQRGETVLHAVVHPAPDVFLVLMANLVASDIAEFLVHVDVQKVGPPASR